MEEIQLNPTELTDEEFNVYKEYIFPGPYNSRKSLLVEDINNDTIRKNSHFVSITQIEDLKEHYDVAIVDLHFNTHGVKFLKNLLQVCDNVVARVAVKVDDTFNYKYSNTELRNMEEYIDYQYYLKCESGFEFWIWSNKNNLESLLTYTEAASWTKFAEFIKNKNKEEIGDLPYITRDELNEKKLEEDVEYLKTLGTTGPPLYVPITEGRKLSHLLTSHREAKWRGWDITQKIVVIVENVKEDKVDNNIYYFTLKDPVQLQTSLEEIQPFYLITHPSVLQKLDCSKIPSLKDIKTTGEPGSNCYYMEEAGIIALQCPDNPKFMHVMENIILESDPNTYSLVVTDVTNKYVQRYISDDYGNIGGYDSCTCGRKLETIRVPGRYRNCIRLLGNQGLVWLFDLHTPCSDKKYQVIQNGLLSFIVYFEEADPLNKKERKEIKKHIQKCFPKIDIQVVFETKIFPYRKFEKFICEC